LSYPFYSAAFGELELRKGRRKVARDHFEAALLLARSPMERQFLQKRVAACEVDDSPAQIQVDRVQKAKAR
jgi:predicted RNA polymerase sigma factor